MGVREGIPPVGEELRARRLPLPAYPARRLVHDIIGEHAREPVNVMALKVSVPFWNASRTVIAIAFSGDVTAIPSRI